MVPFVSTTHNRRSYFRDTLCSRETFVSSPKGTHIHFYELSDCMPVFVGVRSLLNYPGESLLVLAIFSRFLYDKRVNFFYI